MSTWKLKIPLAESSIYNHFHQEVCGQGRFSKCIARDDDGLKCIMCDKAVKAPASTV